MMNWDYSRFDAAAPLEKAVLVDLDVTTRYIITAVSGMPCVRFTSHEKLLSALPRLQPAVIFLDCSLGYCEGGVDLIAEVRAEWPFVPIIAIVDQLPGDRVTQAKAQVVDDFICKPLQASELLVRLRLGVRNRAYLAMALARQYFRVQQSQVSEDDFIFLQALIGGELGKSPNQISLFLKEPALEVSTNGLEPHPDLLQGALRAIWREQHLESLYKESTHQGSKERHPILST